MKQTNKELKKTIKKKRIIFWSLTSTIAIAAVVIPTSVVAALNLNENETNVNAAIVQFNDIQATNNKISVNPTLNNFPSASVNQNNLESYLQNLPTMNSLFANASNYKILPKDFNLTFALVSNSYSSDGTSLKIDVTFSSNIGISHYSKTINDIVVNGFSSYQNFLNNSINNINNATTLFSLNVINYVQMGSPTTNITEAQIKQLLQFNASIKPGEIFLPFISWNIIDISTQNNSISFKIQLSVNNYNSTTKTLVLQLS